MASIGYYKDDKWNHQCGATLISHKHFLTAAHCVKNTTNRNIHVGAFDLSTPRQQGIDVDIKYVNIHPLYNHPNAYFDIAIITTDNVEFTNKIQPICLPKYSSTDVHKYDEKHVDLLGWGGTGHETEPSKTLKRVSQQIFDNEYCNKTHIREDSYKETIKKAVPDLFQSHLICAGTNDRSQGACKGDSGGPLQLYKSANYRYQQVGIVHGSVDTCVPPSSFPGIYTRLDDPAIFDFLKLTLQTSDLHLIAHASKEDYPMVVYNWRTNVSCDIDIFSYIHPLSVEILNGTLMFCAINSATLFDITCAKYLNKEWQNTSPLGRNYEGGTNVPGKGLVMFKSSTGEDREYIKILDSPDGQWKDGPQLPYSGEFQRDCILQLNQTTTFTLRERESEFYILTFDWSTNRYTEHEPALPIGSSKKSSCALMIDEKRKTLVAIVYVGKDSEMQMKLWNPADDSIVSENFPASSFRYLSPALVAINGGTEALLYPGYHDLFEEIHEGSTIWKYNLASKTWNDTGIVFEAKERPMVFPLIGFSIEDFSCI
jgi:hypothetical protein